MNKIKDIIYNKSDIIIAILILAIAALIIFWRLGIILEYPKQLIGTDDASAVLTEPEEGTQTEAENNAKSTANDTQTNAGTSDQNAGESTASEGNASGTEGETKTEETTEVTKTAKWDGDALAADLEVTLVGTTASEAVQCLVDAGVFEDYAEYDSICEEMGYDDEKMRSGVFSFPKGTTREDIIKEVNWS